MGKVAMIFIGYLCLVYGHAVASIPRWNNPCRSSDSAQTISPISISLKDASDALMENAVHFTRVVSDMKADYIPPQGTRITETPFIQAPESFNLHYGYVIGLDLPQEYNITDVTRAFLEDYESFSRLAVFLKQVKEDEISFEHREYLSGMESVESKINLILCNLNIAIHSVVNATMSNFVEPDVSSVRDRKDRFSRDYIIFHKAESFGKVVEEKYRLLSRKISN